MRISRQEVVTTIQYNLTSAGFMVTKVETIEEAPQYLRHACAESGISFLQQQIFLVPQDYGTAIRFPYYYCNQCGKLFVYRFLYD